MRRVVVIVLVCVLLVLGGITGGVVWWLGRSGPPPEMLIQLDDGNLALVTQDGQSRPLTTDSDGSRRIFAFPVPSPDGRTIAYVDTVRGTGGITSSLVAHSVKGTRRVLFESGQ